MRYKRAAELSALGFAVPLVVIPFIAVVYRETRYASITLSLRRSHRWVPFVVVAGLTGNGSLPPTLRGGGGSPLMP
jgi:hypothetical protein